MWKKILVILTMVLTLTNMAKAEERRTAFLHHFELEKGEFVLVDENGHPWPFKLDRGDYSIGDEFTVILPDRGKPYYKIPKRNTLPQCLINNKGGKEK